MIERQCFDEELLFVENAAAVASRELLNRQFERELKVRCPEGRIQKIPESFGPENVQRSFAAIQMKRAEQARNTIEVISVKMTDKNGMDPASFDTGPHELQLRALSAIEQENIALTNEGGGRQSSRECGDG